MPVATAARKPRAARKAPGATTARRGSTFSGRVAKGAIATAKRLGKALATRRYVRLAEEAKIANPEKLIEKFHSENPNYGELLIGDERLREAHRSISRLSDPEKKVLAALLIKYGEAIFENPALLNHFLKGPETRVQLLFDIIERYRSCGHDFSNLLSDVLYIYYKV